MFESQNEMSSQLFKNSEEIISESKFIFMPISELLAQKFPPRRVLVENWMYEGDIFMIYGSRGIGKSYFSISLAVALAIGGDFGGLKCPNPTRVAYIDGEMHKVMIQDRIRATVNGCRNMGQNIDLVNNLSICAADIHDFVFPNLLDLKAQELLIHYLKNFEVIIFDNVSCLFSGRDENKADEWQPIQDFFLRLRRMNKTIIFIHHAGKNSTQRGTSKKEDIADAVFKLDKPEQPLPGGGACFILENEKMRSMIAPKRIRFMLINNNDTILWQVEEVAEGVSLKNTYDKETVKKVLHLKAEGHTYEKIGEKLGMGKSTIGNIVRYAKQHDIT